MSHRVRFSRIVLAGSIAAALFTPAPRAGAAVLTWDGSNPVNVGPDGGAGTWDTNNLINWWNGTGDVVWPDNGADNDALFANTAGAVTIAGGGVTVNDLTFGTTGYVLSGAGTITLNGTTPTINVGTGMTATIGSNTATILAGSAGLTKTGNGTLTLNGSAAHTFTGGVNVNGGVLGLDFSNLATPTNLVGSTNMLSLTGGGRLLSVGKNGAVTAQTFASTIVNSGANFVQVTRNNSTSNTVNLGAVTHTPGGVISFIASGGAISNGTQSTTEMMTVSGVAANAPVGSWAFVNDSTTASARWAVNRNGQMGTITGTVVTANWANLVSPTVVYSAAISDSLVANQSGFAVQMSAAASTGIVTIQLGANTLTIAGMTCINTGNTFTLTRTTGGITVGVGNDLVMAGAGAIRISAPIANGVDGNSNVTYAGGGTLTLDTVASTYTGLTTVNTGTVALGLDNVLNSASGIVVNSGTTLSGTLNYAGFNQSVNSVKLNGGTITSTSGTLTSATAFDVRNGTISGILGGTAGLTKTTAGTVTLSKANTYSGTTAVNEGTLQLGAANALHSSSGVAVNGGTLALTTFAQSVASVLLTGGTISGTTGTLVSAAAFEMQSGRADVVLAGSSGFNKSTGGTVTLTADNTYAGTTTISGGILQVGAGGTTGSLGSGPVQNNATLNFNRSNGSTVGNGISGGGVVNLQGTGTTTFAGANTYTGATNIAAGRVDLAGTFTSNINVAAGANLGGEGATTGALNFAGTSVLFFDPTTLEHLTAGTIAATGGTVTISPTSAAAGTNIVVLEAAGGITGAIGTNFFFGGRGTLHYNNVSQTQLLFDVTLGAIKWKGGNATHPTFWDVTTTANWDNLGATDVFYNLDDVTFDDTASSYTVAVQGTVMPGSVTFNNTNNVYTITGGIGGAGALTKNGGNTVILTGANTYTGGTFINEGTLQLGDGTNGSGSITGAVVNDAAIVTNFGANNATVANAISGFGTLTKVGSGTVSLTGATTYIGGTIISEGTLQVGNGGTTGSLGIGPVSNDAILALNRSDNTLVVGAAISGTGNVTKLGAGTVSLSGFNSYGTTTVTAGVLQIGTGGASGTLGVGDVLVDTGATLAFNRSDFLTATNVIGGPGTVRKAGTGTLVLGTSNIYTGVTAVTGGILLVNASSGVLGDTTGGTTVSANASLALQGDITYTGEALTIAGEGADVANTPGALRNVSGSNEWAGNVTVLGGSTARIVSDSGNLKISGNVTLSMGAAELFVLQGFGTGEISGVISGSGKLVKSALSDATWTLSGANTYPGTTTVSNGFLRIFSLNSVGSPAASSSLGRPITVADGTIGLGGTGSASFTGGLIYLGAGETTDRIISVNSGSAAGAILDQSGTGLLKFTGNLTTAAATANRTLFLRGSSAGAGEFAGIIPNGTGNMALTKSGTGTWTLSGANTYTGATTINGGTLLVNSSIESTVVSVNAGGTLGGSNGRLGTTGTMVTVGAGGTIAPGSGGIGILNIGNSGTGNSVVFGGADGNLATLSIELDAASNASDTLKVSGNLDLSFAFDQLSVTLLNGALTQPQTYTIAIYTGNLFGTFDSVPNLPVGAEINYGTGTNSAITVTMVPEPGTATSLLGGLGLLLARRRRGAGL